ncbi:metalloregulator ArsR/SmtB family transcription factor [Rhizobium sp. LC145]|uniref:ArsR/SmtB family transcription factor n=1 Tax=Rhizobium sp. LC145 TaxID=1120688 RepID=UPI00062A05C8|nr:metalloregulator ArsR/SmtB family transcription factor [Rhizobium sp. LC145]KKX32936.1 ArsR family transcriptional regulator [Rhizobium sp. LC145]TKT57350.1 metalloregulator ArsR/SmtB family transcription factor [Rhizobiaceae bacterium LC148]
MSSRFLMITPEDGKEVLKCLAAPARLSILELLHASGPLNVNDIADRLDLPQSTTSTHLNQMEEAGLIRTEVQKARKGSQKICHAVHDEIVISFSSPKETVDEAIEVAMPVGLYSGYDVFAPCGMCSQEGIIGYLDNPDTFLAPDRMKAGLLWFTRGYVDYQFPNNARIKGAEIRELELLLELSSEVPGTSDNWPSDITISINGKPIVTWTSPGDFGDRRGKYTPDWWKLRGSQYGVLKSFRVTPTGTFIDGVRVSDTCLADLALLEHRSIRLRIEVPETAKHPGGINIFGRGFGNYDQDIILRLKA